MALLANYAIMDGLITSSFLRGYICEKSEFLNFFTNFFFRLSGAEFIEVFKNGVFFIVEYFKLTEN